MTPRPWPPRRPNAIASHTELHDEVGQGLTAVLLGLKRAADQAPDDIADDCGPSPRFARSSLDEVRDVARRLRPGVLDDLGLLSAMAAGCTRLHDPQRDPRPSRGSRRGCLR
ncbi:histidine kinase [Aeromicrobium sp. UC242_57]|uniref:histidine kinase n=1 Tax=Aeromicrobium sp. UC242_57 TaxID=3374624 RepID=UPI00379CF160